MTTKIKNLVVWLLAPFGAAVVSISVFADAFGLGSRNGQFGRWQISGVLAGCLLMAAGRVLSGNARVVWRYFRRVGEGLDMAVIGLMVLLVGLAAVAWVLSNPLRGWDCSDPTADGWVTCTKSVGTGCEDARKEYNVKDGLPEDWGNYNITCVSLDL